MSYQAVKKHFERFGLRCKELEPLENGTKVIGLQVSDNEERLRLKRADNAPEVPSVIIRRSTFSVFRKLVGPFPVCDWLRLEVADIKKRATSVSSGLDDEVRHTTLTRVTGGDLVRGNW